MDEFPEKLRQKLENRKRENTFRELKLNGGNTDFVSNDYLGMAREEEILKGALKIMESMDLLHNGSTGSRLLSGNSELHERTEVSIARYYKAESALLFNSGYDANLGFFSSVPQKSDLVLYDEYVHASMRDGIRMGLARNYKFRHNDLKDLRKLLDRLIRSREKDSQIYLATESVFSMDGDEPDLHQLLLLCEEFQCRLVLDEAHSISGLNQTIPDLDTSERSKHMVFARVVTFGKGMGVQGAAILGSGELRSYLVNYARSFIYSTAIPPLTVASLLFVIEQMEKESIRDKIALLRANISTFLKEVEIRGFKDKFIPSRSAIHSCVIPGNSTVKQVSEILVHNGFDVRPILAPTVPAGMERIRFCMHSFNTADEIKEVLSILAQAYEEIVHA